MRIKVECSRSSWEVEGVLIGMCLTDNRLGKFCPRCKGKGFVFHEVQMPIKYSYPQDDSVAIDF